MDATTLPPATRTRIVKAALDAAGIELRSSGSGRVGTIYSTPGGGTIAAVPRPEFEQARQALTSAGFEVDERPAEGAVPRALLIASRSVRG